MLWIVGNMQGRGAVTGNFLDQINLMINDQ